LSVTQALVLEGKTLAQTIRDEIKAAVNGFVSEGLERPRLLAVQVSRDPSADWYLDQQKKWAEKLGIEFDDLLTPGRTKIQSQKELLNHLNEYRSGGRGKAHGIFLAQPLPRGFDVDEALLALDPKKDVEGVHPVSLGLMVLRKTRLIPPTAHAAYRLIQSTGIALRGKKAVIVGQSAIVGRPLNLLLGEQRVTTTVCNTGTSMKDLQQAVSEADIVAACAGQPGVIKGAWIKPGAVVIDVGTTEIDGKLIGDVEFEEASKRAGFITPVPGGVGPLTVTMLMDNLIRAYKWQKGIS